ncbi:hypothetical protein [uncultured Hyphomicrobium sp.]|uniref:hypothetical protein n=1 Tax=uncultured Hyphomicrobium sp. TaxID=194373 RepID=UPI0025F24030|nr:hypothetical protein [uncultured Hyphomicrobium sp.]
MPRLSHLIVLATALVFLGGCCRDTIREMGSLKDGLAPRAQKRSVAAQPAERSSKSAEVDHDDDDDRKEIETGSVNKPDCQGQHLAYQATKEYLKNFGPKPPDQPGERGPCSPDGR